jgi:quercetin dioxygenase-like cupin family protein
VGAEVVLLTDASPYDVPKHHGMQALRLQGSGASDAEHVSVGLAHFLPDGAAERDASPFEKVDVVVAGELAVITDKAEATLGALDSCRIAPDEARWIENRTAKPASMLVVTPTVRAWS